MPFMSLCRSVAERRSRLWLLLSAGILNPGPFPAALGAIQPAAIQNQIPANVPGVVIDHSPAASGLYIGSPSIAVLTNGDYLASHDFFGPNSKEFECPRTLVFRSQDRGLSWRRVSEIQCQFWANLFSHEGAVYIMGTDKHHGRIVIRRSTDGGVTWSEPRDSRSGLLTASGQYHTAPVPVIEHNGRLWRGFENAEGGTKWGERYRAGMLSVSAEADLLDASNWTLSNFLPGNSSWLQPRFGGWLEGNAVVGTSGEILDVLRVDTPGLPEKVALITISPDGRQAAFAPAQGFANLPGGAKKFTIRRDPRGNGYWTLASIVPGPDSQASTPKEEPQAPASVRNTLALLYSENLRQWKIRSILLHHADVARHGFQYVDWLFDDDDLIAVCRTAYDDPAGGAHSFHDANFLTFHRFKNFRSLAAKP